MKDQSIASFVQSIRTFATDRLSSFNFALSFLQQTCSHPIARSIEGWMVMV